MEIYIDILIEIEILEMRLKDLEKEHRRMWNALFPSTKVTANYSGVPGNPFTSVPLDRAIEDMRKVEEEIEKLEQRIEEKRKLANDIRDKLEQLQGLEKRVAYMRDIEGKSLIEIADELGYSYSWIRKISSRTKKEA